MGIWKSQRQKEKALGYMALSQYIMLVFAFAFTAYLIIFFKNCIDTTDCDFGKFLSPYDPLFVTMIGLMIAIMLSILRYFTNNIKRKTEEFERCAELRKQFIALKNDYKQIKNVKNNYISIVINQKNSRLVSVNNLVDSQRHHYAEEIIKNMFFICEKGMRFPCSLDESDPTKLRNECDIVSELIEDVLLSLDQKPHNKHK